MVYQQLNRFCVSFAGESFLLYLVFALFFSIIMQGYLVEQICQNESAVQISIPYFFLKTNLLYELAQDMLTITLMA
jgi:hypothetical protein